MQRFKSFLLKAFNSDSEIKFWCLVFIITFDSFIFFALFSVAMKLENYVCKNENTFLNVYSLILVLVFLYIMFVHFSHQNFTIICNHFSWPSNELKRNVTARLFLITETWPRYFQYLKTRSWSNSYRRKHPRLHINVFLSDFPPKREKKDIKEKSPF